MATIPFTYENNSPVIDPSLLPLQLALANYMALGNPLAFAPNTRFLQAMKNYCDSFVLSPLDFDPRTGFPRVPDISRNITGIFYLANGNDVYVFRRAQDCGPDENRYEWVKIGQQTEIAAGTWIYYGPFIRSGSVGNGSFIGDYGAGIGVAGAEAGSLGINGQGEGAFPGIEPGTVASDQGNSGGFGGAGASAGAGVGGAAGAL